MFCRFKKRSRSCPRCSSKVVVFRLFLFVHNICSYQAYIWYIDWLKFFQAACSGWSHVYLIRSLRLDKNKITENRDHEPFFFFFFWPFWPLFLLKITLPVLVISVRNQHLLILTTIQLLLCRRFSPWNMAAITVKPGQAFPSLTN